MEWREVRLDFRFTHGVPARLEIGGVGAGAEGGDPFKGRDGSILY